MTTTLKRIPTKSDLTPDEALAAFEALQELVGHYELFGTRHGFPERVQAASVVLQRIIARRAVR